MPAEGKVNIFWQIIFVIFIPIIGIWAFYRVKKLTKYFLYIVLPTIIITILFLTYLALSYSDTIDSIVDGDNLIFPDTKIKENDLISLIFTLVGFPLEIFAIHLIYKWSNEWNKQFETKTN